VDQLLTTKLFIPKPRPDLVSRPRLIEQLNEGLHRKLTLISAPAGFGKTTLVSEWVAQVKRPVAWLSLDKEDGDPRRFLTYLVAALKKILPDIGEGVQGELQSSQSLPIESILTTLFNQIASIPDDIILVLDDYLVIDAGSVYLAIPIAISEIVFPLWLLIKGVNL